MLRGDPVHRITVDLGKQVGPLGQQAPASKMGEDGLLGFVSLLRESLDLSFKLVHGTFTKSGSGCVPSGNVAPAAPYDNRIDIASPCNRPASNYALSGRTGQLTWRQPRRSARILQLSKCQRGPRRTGRPRSSGRGEGQRDPSRQPLLENRGPSLVAANPNPPGFVGSKKSIAAILSWKR